MRKNLTRALAVALGLALIAGACGSDETTTPTTTVPAEQSVTTTTAAPVTTEAPGAAPLAGTSVSVFGPESSDEEAGALRDALDVLAAESGIEISYTGARDAADQINAQAAGGNAPDIFVFPQPGKLADFAREGWVLPLPADVITAMEADWSSAWTAFGNVDGTQYGIPTKSDLKSLVWYKPGKFAEKGYSVPGTWDDLKSLANDMIANGDTPFCVGIESGPATGWTFTDWVEDLMLRMHGADVYDQWVAGTLAFSSPEVTAVFNEVLDLWNTPGMVYASGGSIAATPFGDNGQPLVDDDCMMHRQASFYAAFIPEGAVFADGSPDAIDTFYFPSVKGDYPVLGAGTLVGAFRDAPEVWEVMKYFASSEYAEVRQVAQTERKGGGLSGFLSGAMNQDPSVYQPLEQSFLNILVSADVVRFDASDLMPAAVGAGTFWTEGTAAVNGDKTVAEVTAAIDASWPGAAPLAGMSVSVFGPESSDEEAGALRDALDVLAAESGIEISYTGARDAADQINAQAAGGNAPDIFVFPQPGKLADFAREGWVLPLPADVITAMEADWSSAWTAFGNVDGTQYGIPTKSDLKSLVWYKPGKFAEKGYSVPGTWDDLKSLANDMIANGDTPFCVGIESGPATGWTFTDWVEDLMLRMHGADVYDQWVAGTLAFSSPEVTAVFNEVLDLWNTPGMVYASGGSIAATPFGDNGQPLVDDDCMMHRQASFYAAFIPEGAVFADGSPDAIDTFYFPSVKGDYPVLGAGTLVGAFRDAPEVWEVMKYFASSEYAEVRQVAQTERKGGGLSGFLSGAMNQDPSVYQPLEQSFLNILVSADVVRFDASDLMPAAVGAGTFWTEGTAAVNGDKTVAEVTAAIDASWPAAAPAD